MSSQSAAAAPATEERIRAYRYALDLTPAQADTLARHAGAARWAFNHAIAAKVAAHQAWRSQVDQLVADGTDEAAARKSVKVPFPTKPTIQKAWNLAKGDSRTGVDGLCPWWHEMSTFAFQSAFIDADTAWRNWLDSLAGRRAGRRVGYPRFKKKGRAQDSFRLHHDVKRPTIRLEGYRRLQLPRIGQVRLHGTSKDIARLVDRGHAVIQSVTISRAGHRWYASILAKTHVPAPVTTRAQRAAGVDLGVKQLAALSDGTLIPNPRELRHASKALARAQQALSRTKKGSRRREHAKALVGRRHHGVAMRRASALHQLTKRLATGWAGVAIEDLHVAGMTRSARGTINQPGRNVRAKAGLNRSVLDAAFGELRRQLTYKTTWHGSTLHIADRWAPTSKTLLELQMARPKPDAGRADVPLPQLQPCDGPRPQCGLEHRRRSAQSRGLARLRRPRYGGDAKRPPRGHQTRRRHRRRAAPSDAGRPRPRSGVTPAEQSAGVPTRRVGPGQLAPAHALRGRPNPKMISRGPMTSGPRAQETTDRHDLEPDARALRPTRAGDDRWSPAR